MKSDGECTLIPSSPSSAVAQLSDKTDTANAFASDPFQHTRLRNLDAIAQTLHPQRLERHLHGELASICVVLVAGHERKAQAKMLV